MLRKRAQAGGILVCFLALSASACGVPEPGTEPGAEPSEPGHPAVTIAPSESSAMASIGFTVGERDLLPENIAFDPVTETFYVGSSRHGKIVKVEPDGSVGDFVSPRQHGLWMVMGMKVDAERRMLWVASSDGDNLAGHRRSKGRSAGIFQFDLDDGRLLDKWVLDAATGTHFFNDLVVTPSGEVYATHMFNRPLVYIVGAASGELEVFARPGGFTAPNGIAVGDDGTIYVAHREGLSAFDPATAQRAPLLLPEGASFSPIDGLYFHRGTLIGIHPDEGLVRRFELEGSAVTRIDTLEADHPAIGGLTTGVVVDDDLYFVADSQFDRLSDGQLPPAAELEDVVVLKLPLAG